MILAALLLLQAAPVQASAQPAELPPPAFPNPSEEAIALGRRLAETGTLATLLPMIAAKNTEELIAEHPELSAAEQTELRSTAAATLEGAKARLFGAQGRAYAERLSVADLRVLAARNGDAVSLRFRDVMVPAIAATTAAVGSLDFKKDALTAFCVKTGKACAN